MNLETIQTAMQIILHAGDARLKTSEALSCLKAFDIEKAKELIDACEGVICDRTEFGTYEQFNSRLYEYAVSTGKIIKIPFLEEQLAQL